MSKPFYFHLTQKRQKQAELLGKVASGQQDNGLKNVFRNRNGNSNQENQSNIIPTPAFIFPGVGLIIQRYRQKNLLLEATTKNASLRSILKRFCEKLNYGLS